VIIAARHFGPRHDAILHHKRMKQAMRKLLTALALTTALATAATAADKNYVTLAKSNFWYSFFTKSPKDTPICGMAADTKDGRRSVMIKWYESSDAIVLQAFKQGWKIPADAEVKMEVEFDGTNFSDGQATGNTETGVGYLELIVGDASEEFLAKFAGADKMSLNFPEGNEKAWTVELKGAVEIFILQVHQKSEGQRPDAAIRQCADQPAIRPGKEVGAHTGQGTGRMIKVVMLVATLATKCVPRHDAIPLQEQMEQANETIPVSCDRDADDQHRSGICL
jgi:hypothetical protein